MTLPLELLSFYISNKQCEHILLACCHDTGYIPVLRQYAAHPPSAERITLLTAGFLHPNMATLGFCNTENFNSMFWSSARVSPVMANKVFTTSTGPPSDPNPVSNADRLGPVIRNYKDLSLRRIDKCLSVEESLVEAMRKRNMCHWHYLRADCKDAVTRECTYNHSYRRPLSDEEFDAVWFLSRKAICYRAKRGTACDDDRCIYGHSTG